MKPLLPLEVLRALPPHDETLPGMLASRVGYGSARTALEFDDRRWTWAELATAVARMARVLRSRGAAAGDRIAIMGQNHPCHVILLHAVARIGAVMVPINPEYKVGEAAHVLGRAAPRGVLHTQAVEDVVREASRAAGIAPWLLDLDAALAPVPGDDARDDDPVDASDPDAACVIVFTSGSTGFPKGAVHSQRNVVLAGESFVERMHLQPDDRLMVVLPMFHINALFYSVAGALAAGAALLVERRFSASTFWQRVHATRATEINIIEAIGTILLARPETEFVPGHALAKVYGARDAIVPGWKRRFGIEHLVGGYAMTEIPGILSTPFGRPNTPGSMGRLCRHPDHARPWTQCRIVDDDLHDVDEGVIGELMVRTPIAMKGYFGDDAATRAAFVDGWFRTGDLVRRDADGAYFFVSRKNDIIRRRGENVAGAEIDRVLTGHGDLEVAAAIGVPSEFGDQDILVAAVRRAGATISEADVVEYCALHLAPTKVPRFVVFLDKLPQTPTHKVAKATLRSDATLRGRAVDFGARRARSS